MAKKFLSLLLSCVCLVSSSNSMDNLNSINDLSNTDNNINTITMSNIQPNNNIINFEEDQKEENNQEVNNENTINNNQNNTNTKKKKKKKHRKKKNKNQKSVQENNVQKEDYEQVMPDIPNSEIINKNIELMNNSIDKYIQSDKFKMLGTLHQKIVNSTNYNEIYNKFNINHYTLNKYKQYYNQLRNYIKNSMDNKIGEIVLGNNNNAIKQLENIINDIYKLLNGNNQLTDIDEIMVFFINEKISSEQDLQGNNIFKIIANLAVAINEHALNTKFSCSKLTLDLITSSNNNKVLDFSGISKTFEQLIKIITAFEINID